MSRPVISTPKKKTHSTFTNPSFLEAQLSFIGHSLKRNTHKQPFLFKILESVLIATTCVITQATKQMQGNDFSVQIAAETWREIWQNALRICSSSSTEENSALTTNWRHEKISRLGPQWKMTEDTYNRSMWPGHNVACCRSNIVQELESIFGAGCDVNPLLSGFLVGKVLRENFTRLLSQQSRTSKVSKLKHICVFETSF